MRAACPHEPMCMAADFDFGEGQKYTALKLNFTPLIPEADWQVGKVKQILN